MSSVSAEVREANQDWHRRQTRVPAKFGSHLAYCRAVEEGLLDREPQSTGVETMTLQQIRNAVQRATTEPMPPWKPRPQGPSLCNIYGLVRGTVEHEPDEVEERDD